MEWPNTTIEEFLSLYLNEPTLWNSKSAEHKNKNDHHDAWIRIKNKLNGGTIPLKDIKKKRDNLMATYRRLRRQVSQSLKSGSGADDTYKPDWPFYSTMSSFLDTIYCPRTTKNSEVTDGDDIEEIVNNSETDAFEDTNQDNEGQAQFKRPKLIPKRSKKNETETKMDEAYDVLKQMTQKLQNPQDECTLYTQLLCKKLRGLQEHTREIAMLEIDRLIFSLKQSEAQLINFGHPHNFHQYPRQQTVQNYNSTPPHTSFNYHPSFSSQSSPNYRPSPTLQASPNYYSSSSPRSLQKYKPTSSFQPNYHPSPSPNYNQSPSFQPSPNYHPSSSPNYNQSPSFQPSPNYHLSPSLQPSPNYNPSVSPQPSHNYPPTSSNLHPSPSPEPSPTYPTTIYPPQPSPNDHSTSSSPQLLEDETLSATKNLMKHFYEQQGEKYSLVDDD